MKKVTIFLTVTTVLLATAVSAFAFSGIQFLVTDNKTSMPWGTAPGQSYRIYIVGSSSGTLLDTGTLTTPADPVLDFTCSYGAACPAGAATTLFTPASDETVTVYMVLTGTSNNPSTITESYTQPPIDLGTFTINRQSGTGPTAITMNDFGSSSNGVNFAAVGILALLLVGSTFIVLRRRNNV